jgi:prepilin-type N-terminal cleavage/methylation domain-containing protein
MQMSTKGAGRRFRGLGRGGFSLPELAVACAVVGILFLMTVPFFLSYYRAAAIKVGSQQVIVLFNQARELAVKQNDDVCVQLPSSTQMQLRVGGCAGPVWIGPGTDAAGNINLPQGFTLAPLTAIVFSYLGAALPATTYTLTDSTSGATITVSIALTGRIASP